MKKLFAGISLILMSVILYSANAIAVAISKINYSGQSDVGYSLLLFSGITFILGIIILLMLEKDQKYNANKAE